MKKDCIHCVSIIPFPFSLALFSASTHIVSICLLSFRLTLTFMCIIIIIIIIRISSFADEQFKHNKQVIRINFVNIKAYCLSQVYNPVCQHIQISPQQKKWWFQFNVVNCTKNVHTIFKFGCVQDRKLYGSLMN